MTLLAMSDGRRRENNGSLRSLRQPHTMSNPYDEELIYLLGGTRKAIDISEYPRSRTRAYKFDGKRHTVKFDDVKES